MRIFVVGFLVYRRLSFFMTHIHFWNSECVVPLFVHIIHI